MDNNYPSDDELAMMVTGQRTVPAKSQRDNDIALAEKVFRENLPVAAAVICGLAVNAEKETTRLNAAKYVVERVLGRVDVARQPVEDNPYDFIEGLLREPTAAERREGRPVSRD